MNEATNVVELEQRRGRPPLASCEIRLDETTYGLEVTLYDVEGNVMILSYGLEAKPRDFDLSLLAAAWARWRQTSEIAS